MKHLRVVGPILLVAAWIALRLYGCELGVCKWLGAYTFRVRDLGDYVDYVAGGDLYAAKGASSLAFSCDSLRDQLVARLHESLVKDAPLGSGSQLRGEVTRLELLGARRDRATLHLMNSVTVGSEGLDRWVAQTRSLLERDPQDRRQEWLPVVTRRLFSSVVLHAGDRQAEISFSERYKCE